MCRIIQGARYRYTAAMPAACTGHLYQVLRLIKAVPAYQEQVLVRAETGPDKGLWFAVSPGHFSMRYVLVPEEEPAPVEKSAPRPERVFGRKSEEIA